MCRIFILYSTLYSTSRHTPIRRLHSYL